MACLKLIEFDFSLRNSRTHETIYRVTVSISPTKRAYYSVVINPAPKGLERVQVYGSRKRLLMDEIIPKGTFQAQVTDLLKEL